MGSLFADYFNEYSFFSPAIELTIKDLFPGAEIKSSVSDGNNHFTSHDLSFEMRIGIIFIAIVTILMHRLMRRQLFQPDLIIVMQPGFVIVDKYGGSDVHGIYQANLVDYRNLLALFATDPLFQIYSKEPFL